MARFSSVGSRQFTSIGRSGIAIINYVFSSNTTQTTINPAALTGYKAGKTRLTITVNSGVYVYSTNTGNAGLTISGFSAGDTIALVNNGYIIGKGGKGGNGNFVTTLNSANGSAGGPALSLGANVTLTNNGYIAGGGGGGGTGAGGGGGGAGGGDGGNTHTGAIGASGGLPGAVGSNGTVVSAQNWHNANGSMPSGSYFVTVGTGAGGGRILPGVGGADSSTITNPSIHTFTPSNGGGAGGGGGVANLYDRPGGQDWSYLGRAGGSANNVGSNAPIFNQFIEIGYWGGAAGGGGWGAAGGNCLLQSGTHGTGGAGGKGIALNGYSVTYITTGTIYGAVS